MTNGELPRDAGIRTRHPPESGLAGYEVLLTVDQGIPHQTNQLEDLLPFVEAILNALERMSPGQIVPIG